MPFGKCKNCGDYHFDNEKCKPLFEYQIPEYHGADEWYKVRAHNFNEAAEKACERDDADGDYTIIHGGGIEKIMIRDKAGTVKAFSIEAEAVPQYHAREIKPEEAH